MEIVDAHQHFWHYRPDKHDWITDEMKKLRHDFLPSDLKKELNRHGVDACVAVQADQSEEETDFLLGLAREHSFIQGVVGWVGLQSDSVEERLEHYSTFVSVKGFRHIVQDEPDDRFLLRADFLRGIAKLNRFNFTYDILIYEQQLPAAVEFAHKFPEQTFILDHIAKPEIRRKPTDRWEQGIRELAQHPSMYCKISGLVTEADWDNWQPDEFKPYLDIVFDAFGVERLMFGSDWPVCTLAADYGQLLGLVTDYISTLQEDEQALVLAENSRKAYGLGTAES